MQAPRAHFDGIPVTPPRIGNALEASSPFLASPQYLMARAGADADRKRLASTASELDEPAVVSANIRKRLSQVMEEDKK